MILSADEKTCVLPITCNAEQFPCKSGKVHCIPKTWYCDGMAECTDASDEENCPVCSHPNYKCPGKNVCLNPAKICDGYDDCPDQSDESCCRPQDFLCQPENRKHCISRSHICDGKRDCANAADEELERCTPLRVGIPVPDNHSIYKNVEIIDNKTASNIASNIPSNIPGNVPISETNTRDPSVTIAHPPNTYSAVIIICVVVFGIIISMIFIFRRGNSTVEGGMTLGYDPPPDLTHNHYPPIYMSGISEVTMGKRVISPISGITTNSFVPKAVPHFNPHDEVVHEVYIDGSNTGISSNSSSNGPRISLGLHNGTGHAIFPPTDFHPPSPVDHYDSSTRSSSHAGGACGGTSSSSGDRNSRRRKNKRIKRYDAEYPEELEDLHDHEDDLDDAYYGIRNNGCPPPYYGHVSSFVEEDDDDMYDDNDNRYLHSNPPPTENNSPALSPSPSTERVFHPSFNTTNPPPPSPAADD
jgi:hypothetical protein